MNNLFKAVSIFLLTSALAFADPIIDIEKTTNGPTNANPTIPDYNNEDAAGGPGVPILTPGSTVTWTYRVSNIGDVSFAFGEVRIVDNNGTPGSAADDLLTDNGLITFFSAQTGDADNILEPGEVWLYNATGIVQTGAYENRATVSAPGAPADSDLSHYRTPLAIVDIEKTTNGPTNANPTAPDYDNEDTVGGPGVPILMPGSAVTWTYQVSNIGDISFAFNEVTIVDDNGTPGSAADDLLTDNGLITFLSVQTGDADNIVEPGEVWLYKATGTAQNVSGVYENRATVAAPGAPGDSDLSHYTGSLAAVPEPETLSLFATGVAAILALRRRKKFARLVAR
jgi:hypothetical protein